MSGQPAKRRAQSAVACRFEKGTAADANAVMENIAAVRAGGFSDWDEEYPARAHILEDAARGALYVLRAPDGKILASVAAHFDDAEFQEETAAIAWRASGRACSFSRLCVRPDWQRAGLGYRLLHETIEYLCAEGCACARLLTNEENSPAKRLYEKLGFCLCGRARLYGLWFDAYERDLKNNGR